MAGENMQTLVRRILDGVHDGATDEHPLPSAGTSEAERLWKIASNDSEREHARELLRVEANNGCQIAHLLLAYTAGSDEQEAIEHALAADTGESLYYLAKLLITDTSQFGMEVRSDYVRRAAEKGCIPAQIELGSDLCCRPEGATEGLSFLERAVEATARPDESARMKYYAKINTQLFQGIGDSILAQHYQASGRSDLAARHYIRGSERGNATAQYHLGKLFLDAGHIDDGMSYMRMAADGGSSNAQFTMGTMLLDQAIMYLGRAAQQGHIEARERLTSLSTQGTGTTTY